MTELLIVTALAIALDVATGFAGAVKTGCVMSGKMRDGLWHKAGFAFLIVTAFLLEYAVAHVPTAGVEVPYVVDACEALETLPLVLASCWWVILTEMVSVTENLCAISPQVAGSPLGKIFANRAGGE